MFNRSRWFRIAIGIILFLVIIFLLDKTSYILRPLKVLISTLFLPFFIAGILFYLFRPIQVFLEKRSVPKKLSILIVFLAIIAVLSVFVGIAGPIIQEQFTRLINNFPDMVSKIEEGITYWQNNQQEFPTYVNDFIDQTTNQIKSILMNTGTVMINFFSSLFGLVLVLVIVPFILFYMLNDKDHFLPSVLKFFPESSRDDVASILKDMDSTLAKYIQGQLIVSTCVGVLLLIGYSILGLHYSLVLSLFGMMTNVIPFIGPYIAVVPAIIVALFQDPFMVIYVVIIMLVAQQIESNFISPNVVGKALDIHPLTIICLVLAAGNFAGIMAVVLAIPTYAVTKVFVIHIYKLWKTQSKKQT
ncbi:AI-2E family transporter [Tuberibacillus sp. Marseille-P3662]|uniref:AI-2E family transporter n=1 Tax=Tuberibacillus sp. Marseille-P3662 TaxID=1965358 RepID=UPI0020CAB801|nr:AI-2E family transporter [Tuberibacillus sp. Marseille-P3662]